MEVFLGSFFVIIGLTLFEVVSSVDNAVINAEALSKMSQKARKWFLTWGLLFAVFAVRGLLPLLIVWVANPTVGLWEVTKGVFSGDAETAHAIEQTAPYLLLAGGVFLLFLFFNWIFLEEKNIGLSVEKFFAKNGIWFYSVVSVLLVGIVYEALVVDPKLALAAVIGSTAFFITHGFQQQAEIAEKKLLEGETSKQSDLSKILFLVIIDAIFSIDGVVGAFAFTLSVPLILLGNGLGAIVVRQLTISNIDRIKKLIYLKNGAMYSLLVLGSVMTIDAFGGHIPEWFTPLSTVLIISYFYIKSARAKPVA